MIDVPYVRTVDNIADFFTKPLPNATCSTICATPHHELWAPLAHPGVAILSGHVASLLLVSSHGGALYRGRNVP